jgi:hypothetical protein
MKNDTLTFGDTLTYYAVRLCGMNLKKKVMWNESSQLFSHVCPLQELNSFVLPMFKKRKVIASDPSCSVYK